MDYIEQVSAGIFDHASESIDKAEEEHGEVNTSLPIETEQTEVESGESSQDFADQGLESPPAEKEERSVDRNPDAQYTRATAFNAATGQVEVETPEEFEKAETAKERLAEIRSVNEELKRQGDNRRYVASTSEVPDTAQAYEDEFGKYYYKQVQIDVRPSDIASFADVKSVVALDDDTRALKTIQFLSSMYADPLIDASTEKAAETWLDRHLVLTDDDPGSNDTFSHEFKSHIASLIARATPEDEEENSKRRAEDKQNVPDEAEHFTNPDDIPDDYTTVTGPQGGVYGVPPGAEEDEGGDEPPYETGRPGMEDEPAPSGRGGDEDQPPFETERPGAMGDEGGEDAEPPYETGRPGMEDEPEPSGRGGDEDQPPFETERPGAMDEDEEQETTVGFAGEMPWGEDTQSVAEGISSDVAGEAQSGGAYQGRDRQEVLDIAEENAREYAEDADVPVQEFIEEVRTQVDMQLDQP